MISHIDGMNRTQQQISDCGSQILMRFFLCSEQLRRLKADKINMLSLKVTPKTPTQAKIK